MKARLVKRFRCFSALCAALAEVLGSKVCLSRDKFNTMCCLEAEQVRKLITTDWKAARVHVLPMMQLTFKVSAAAPAHPHKWCTCNCVIFKMVTGLHRFRNHCLTSDTFSFISFWHFLFLSVCVQKLQDHLARFSGQYDQLVAFKPTGWTFSQQVESVEDIQPHTSGNISIYGRVRGSSARFKLELQLVMFHSVCFVYESNLDTAGGVSS